MAIQMAVGDESFEEIRKAGRYYVDKTELLYDLVRTGDKVTLITRPRRFGKTLNMSMMECFLDVNKDSREVFEGLAITQHEEFCHQWMNQYPVLSISFKGVNGLNFDDAYIQLQTAFADLCKMHTELLRAENVDDDDKEYFRLLKSRKLKPAELKSGVKTLMRMMTAVYEKPVILLIDEYDVPLAKASENNTAENDYYVKMLNVIRGIFEAALKTNEYLKFAVVTGCLRITKESIFTGTNNFSSYSVLDADFAEYFGFTQQEVDQLLMDASCSSQANIVKEWYDGYVFGDTSVYCPWDVVSYVSRLVRKGTTKPENFWLHTSGNTIIREFVTQKDWGISDKFEVLLNGGSIRQEITDELTYESLYGSEENLWSVLLMTGYLTKADISSRGEDVALRIPNAEIAGIFEQTVVRLFQDTLDINRQKSLMTALWDGDTESATKHLSGFLWDTISYHDYHENYYHAFMAGLFVGLGYIVSSNKESGLGRFDVLVKDKKNRRAMIIEAKRSGSREQMEKDCEKALDQIRERGYADGIDPGYETVRCYGIAFFQKTALVKEMHDSELM